jgi:type I restriction enzyme S subunit
MRAFQGALGVASEPGLVSPDYAVLRVSAGHDPRFLAYTLRSLWGVSQMASRLRGIGGLGEGGTVRTPRVNVSDVGQIDARLPSRSEQSAVADFLDREHQRIGALRRTVSDALLLLRTDTESLFGDIAARHATQVVPLRRLITSMQDGPFGSSLASAHYTDAGEVRVIRLGNIGRAEFRDEDRAYVSAEYAAAELAGHYVSPGNVLVAGLGDVNHPLARSCVVPSNLGPAIHKADCYRVVVDESRCAPDYLALALSFGPATQVAPLMSRGATRARLNTVVARDLPVLWVQPAAQEAICRDFDTGRSRIRDLEVSYRALDILLLEYRDALVTEAVTGQLQVAKVSNAQMDENLHRHAEEAA